MSKSLISHTSSTLVRTENVSYAVKNKLILDDIDLSINSDEIITIIGPNGAGKSTLLKVLLGLIKPTSGRVFMKKGLVCGFVPQSINRDETFPITVTEFLKLSKRYRHIASEILTTLGISHLAHRFIYQLSGGEIRKVLLARALLNEPELLVLDEPTAGVDINGQSAFYDNLNALRKQYQFSILLVSHDLHFVMSRTDKVICLNKHVCCSGTPETIENDEAFISAFGETLRSQSLAVFSHRHDHEHR